MSSCVLTLQLFLFFNKSDTHSVQLLILSKSFLKDNSKQTSVLAHVLNEAPTRRTAQHSPALRLELCCAPSVFV